MHRLVMFLHILGVVAFVGAVFSGLLWQTFAARRKNQQVTSHTYHVLNLFDKFVTPISVTLIAATGVMLAKYASLPIFGTGWIFWSLIIWSSSGILFVVKLFPIQQQLELDAMNKSQQNFPSKAHNFLARKWVFWAHTIFAIIVVTLGLMIMKPTLPAL